MSSKLHSSLLGEGEPVVLLHGLFGAGNNLGALARALSDRYQVHSVDLPNHGRSDWVDSIDLSSMAASLEAWMVHHGLDDACWVGHSLGGKVAMELALSRPGRVRALVVADIAPVVYPPRHADVFAALEAVEAAPCSSRQEAAQRMAEHIDEEGVVQFLLTSLRRADDGSFRWRFNLKGLHSGYDKLIGSPSGSGPFQGPVQFLKGGDSDYVLEDHRHHIVSLFPQAELKVMPGCGHWLHAERPRLFNNLVGRFLDAQAG